MDIYYVGTDLKLLTKIEAEGFSMDTDDIEIILRCGNKSYETKPEEFVKGSDGNWYLLVNTKQFGSGILQMIVIAQVPDRDFPDGARAEVTVKDIAKLQKP